MEKFLGFDDGMTMFTFQGAISVLVCSAALGIGLGCISRLLG